MWHIFCCEIKLIAANRWELFLLFIAPLLTIIFMASMLQAGSPQRMSIVVVDQDRSPLSRSIIENLQASKSLKVTAIESSMQEAENSLKTLSAWAVVQIPENAQKRLSRSKSAQIVSYYNEAFYSVAGTVTAGINSAVSPAIAEFQRRQFHQAGLPVVELAHPSIQVAPLYNAQLSYELFLEPFAVTAILHLLLACCVAGATARAFLYQPDLLQKAQILTPRKYVLSSLLGTLAPYILIFSCWCFLWTFWLMGIRGWHAQGSLGLLSVAQCLLFTAYALFASSITLLIRDINSALSVIAIYAGSSLSYAGVTLPTNTASLFTKFWSNSLPYTSFIKLQTQQWIIGAPLRTSLPSLLILIAFITLFGVMSWAILNKNKEAAL